MTFWFGGEIEKHLKVKCANKGIVKHANQGAMHGAGAEMSKSIGCTMHCAQSVQLH